MPRQRRAAPDCRHNRRMDATVPRLQLSGITKGYPAVVANDDIDLAVLPGEIHAVLGENGAGKSTLMKIIYGVVKPDAGTIRWERQAGARSPIRPRRGALGIGMVFQHFSLFETLTVAENIALALDARPRRRRPRPRASARCRQRYGLPLDPRPPRAHDVGRRAPARRDRALPAAGPAAADHGRADVGADAAGGRRSCSRRCAGSPAEGCSILYISHKLDEIRALCHNATVLRGGPRHRRLRSAAGDVVGARAHDDRRRPAASAASRSAHARRRRAGRARSVAAGRRSLRHRRSSTSTSTCAAARSSASPASPATARRS